MNVLFSESNYYLYLAIWTHIYMVYIGVYASYQNKFRWISNTSCKGRVVIDNPLRDTTIAHADLRWVLSDMHYAYLLPLKH